jgi:hypothetical protein
VRLSTPTIRFAAAVGFHNVLLIGFVRAGLPRRYRRFSTVLITVTALKSSLPLAIALILQLFGPSIGFRTYAPYAYILALCIWNFLATLLSWRAWAVFYAMSSDIDAMFDENKVAAEHVASWLIRRLAQRPQILTAAFGVALGVAFLASVSGSVSQHLEIKTGSYVTVALTCALGANGIYWLETMTEFVFRCLRAGGPKSLVWHCPAQTPVLREFSGAYWLSAAFFIPLAAITEILALLVPEGQQSTGLSVFLIGFPMFAVFCSFVLVGVGHLLIAGIVKQGKARSLDRIHSIIGGIDQLDSVDRPASKKELLGLYDLVLKSPPLPFSITAYVPFAVALIGPLAAFLLAKAL